MIPKTIHYCWFGRQPLPSDVIKCIESWRKFFPDYEIKQWDEDSFDVNIIPYTAEAYKAKKYAFVSDYARFWILYKHGGLYFDTDVEIIRGMDDIVATGAFMGAEIDGSQAKSLYPVVNPGLCIGAPKGLPLFERILNEYSTMSYWGTDGNFNKYTMIPMVSDLLKADGMKMTDNVQKVGDVTIYPVEYFNPLNSITGKLSVTVNTRSIHWYMASWMPKQNAVVKRIKQLIHQVVGVFK